MSRLSLSSLLLCVAVGAAGASPVPEPDMAAPPDSATIARYRELATEGSAQMARRDAERAATLFREIETLVPSSAEGPYLLAGALARLGRLEDARQALARAVLSGMTDYRRMQFDAALAPLRGDPVFEALVSLATAGADAMVAGRALGASPAGPAFEDLDSLRAHFDAIEEGAVRWRSVQSPTEYDRLRWKILDARRGALAAFARSRHGKTEGDEALLDAVEALGRYREPVARHELKRALDDLDRFRATRADSPLMPRARWLALHLRRQAISSAMVPAERDRIAAELEAEIESFVAEAAERGWPEGGFALLDLAAGRHALRRDPSGAVARMRELYGEDERVWAFARDREAALLLRVDGVPAFEAADLDGRPRGRQALLGRVVLLDFWATWCSPCLDQIPELALLHRDLDPDRFLLLGVSIDHADDLSAEDFSSFLGENAIDWPQVRDGLADESDLVRAFGLEAVPFQVLMAPDGSVIEAGPRVDVGTVREAVAALGGS